MFLLPLVEIRRGESVHVLQYPAQGEARPLMDPVEVVTRFSGMGAPGFHLIDVDHSRDEKLDNDVGITRVLDATRLPVMVGGGVRSLRRIQELLDTGARRILVGTMGVENPAWLKEASVVFQELLVPCIDTDGTRVLTHGRAEAAPQGLEAMLKAFDALGAPALHIGYVGQDGGGPELAMRLAKTLRTLISYQGPVDDEATLERLAAAGVHGVIVGPEAYDGRLPMESLFRKYRA